MIDQENSIINKFQQDVEYGNLGLYHKVEYPAARLREPPDERDPPWARVVVDIAGSIPIELGSEGTDQTSGNLIVQLFGSRNKGGKEIGQLAQQIIQKFNRISTSEGVTFFSCYATKIEDEGTFIQRNVICPFIFNEVILDV